MVLFLQNLCYNVNNKFKRGILSFTKNAHEGGIWKNEKQKISAYIAELHGRSSKLLRRN